MLDWNYRLHKLFNAAGLHEQVRHRLLNGQRRQVALEFELSEQEVEAVMAVQAETLSELARGLRELTGQRQSSAHSRGAD